MYGALQDNRCRSFASVSLTLRANEDPVGVEGPSPSVRETNRPYDRTSVRESHGTQGETRTPKNPLDPSRRSLHPDDSYGRVARSGRPPKTEDLGVSQGSPSPPKFSGNLRVPVGTPRPSPGSRDVAEVLPSRVVLGSRRGPTPRSTESPHPPLEGPQGVGR